MSDLFFQCFEEGSSVAKAGAKTQTHCTAPTALNLGPLLPAILKPALQAGATAATVVGSSGLLTAVYLLIQLLRNM